MRTSNEILSLLIMQISLLLNDLSYDLCSSLSSVLCANHHSLDTLELGAISTAQKANMCADALVLPVIIVIKIQPLGAVEKLTFLLYCFSI